MSLSATLTLINKLASSVSGGTPGSFSSLLKSGAKSSNSYGLKIDLGAKKDWLVKAINTDANPTIIDPNGTDTPMTFSTKDAAKNFIAQNHLVYKYSETDISPISVATLIEYTSADEEGVNQMADNSECGLTTPCTQKYNQVISQGRTPSVSDYISAIKQKMSQWYPL